MTTPPDDPHGQWHRLDPKSILAVGATTLASLLPVVVLMALGDTDVPTLLITVGIGLAVIALVLGGAAVNWYFTYYRVTEHRFERRAGKLSRSHRSIPRDRIRSVDLTAPPAHRLFGLSIVKIGTGQQAGENSELKLDAIATPRAEALRRELLRADTEPTGTATAEASEPGETEIARLRPLWLGYSMATVSLVLVVWGALVSAIGTLNNVLTTLGVFDTAGKWFETLPLWTGITVVVLILLILGVLGPFLLSLEMWWGFRLTREQDATLRVRRGLLTTRSLSLEERRLRGIELAEPLLLRWVGGARTNAVATGLGEQTETKQPDRKAILPPAPRAEADRVAAAVLRENRPVTDNCPVAAHPGAALRRRLTRALVGPVALVIALAVCGAMIGWMPSWVWIPALGTVPIAIGLAVDAYRNLGHALDGKYVITRSGTGIRRTVALRRSGVIGWRMKQSLFQRRSGLITISATTAAGAGVYAVRDVAVHDGLTFADEAVPDLLVPFLETRRSRKQPAHRVARSA
ncbi:putative membrane protein [Halopolyspora algeriensis]|uniref:Putative membrane protein n=1 Tax=Halopolyspora algeriensis TaxID=1500506 RepID=A0A368VSG8_9ACTN|nr:PH domain-containing protein [Halopolyspora algeriensis]RCW42916.1 putative membrane protein [Halopolyspora algeriensis]TQM56615.1 putative membrane protein [Halopolyspora algeriensis]